VSHATTRAVHEVGPDQRGLGAGPRLSARLRTRRSISATHAGHVTNGRRFVHGLNGRAPQSATAGAARRAWMVGFAFPRVLSTISTRRI
jgi:hypothetical protein